MNKSLKRLFRQIGDHNLRGVMSGDACNAAARVRARAA
jgi:hypothetical protein